MKANELRIGNYVNADLYNDTNILVESICSKNNDIFNSVAGEIPLSSVKPIPLTEDWLLRFGAQEYSTYKNKKWFYIGDFSYEISTNTFFTSKDYDNDKDIVKTEYVHQLQNLYFALTNEELTLKE